MPSDDDIPFVDRSRLRWTTTPNTLLGEGSFGIVYRGKYNGTPVAIKVVRHPPVDSALPEEYQHQETAAMRQHRREIHRFHAVQNPYIIQYLGVFRDLNPRDLYIVTEFLEGGSLHESLTRMRYRKAVLEDGSFLRIALHIAYGLNHVHASQYTHGDMKPQNVLLTSSFNFHPRENAPQLAYIPASSKVKIADFGLSKRLEGAESPGIFGSTTATTDFGTGPCGTFLYMSPEAYQGVSQLQDSDAKAADVYAYSLILFELLSGLQTWALERVKNPIQLNLLVREGTRPSWGPRKPHINPKYVQLVERCWSHAPEDRPTVDQIVLELENLEEEYRQDLENTSTSNQPLSPRSSCLLSSHSNTAIPKQPSSSLHSSAALSDPRSSSSAHPPSPPSLSLPLSPLPSHKQPCLEQNSQNDHEPVSSDSPCNSNSELHATPDSPPQQAVLSEVVSATGNMGQETPSDNRTSNPVCEHDNDEFMLSEDGGLPTFVHVESMRKLSLSQAEDLPYLRFRGHGEVNVALPPVRVQSPESDSGSDYSDEDDDEGNGEEEKDCREGQEDVGCVKCVEEGRKGENGMIITHNRPMKEGRAGIHCGETDSRGSLVRLCKDDDSFDDQGPVKEPSETYGDGDDSDRDEIDRSIIGNVRVTHVQSVRILEPEVDEISLPTDNSGRGVWGMGSIDQGVGISLQEQGRSNSALLDSFYNAALGEETGGNEEEESLVTPPEHEQREEGGSSPVVSKGPPIGPSLNISAVLAEPQVAMAPVAPEEPVDINGGIEKDAGDPETPDQAGNDSGEKTVQENCYTSPNVDIDMETFSELMENDNLSLSSGILNPSSKSVTPEVVPNLPNHGASGRGAQHVSQAPQRVSPSIGSHVEGANGALNISHLPQRASRPPGSRVEGINASTPQSSGHIGYTPTLHGHLSNPNTYGSLSSQGASAPPLSDTSQSAIGGSPSRPVGLPLGNQIAPWHSPGSELRPQEQNIVPVMNLNALSCGGTVDISVNTVVTALSCVDRCIILRNLWNCGHGRTVATGLARCKNVGGEELLNLVCRFITQNNSVGKDAGVARDLCTTIGHIARNGSKKIGAEAVVRAIPVTVSVMVAFNRNAHQHVEVFSSCNFALCNLFMVHNVINDRNLRTNVASWIEYTISWNVYEKGSVQGPHVDTLAYTATSAARNFMWMNEANVAAFVNCNRGGSLRAYATSRLIESMMYFDYVGQMRVLEESLTALAMIIHVPRQRVEFMNRHGAEVVIEVAHRHARNEKVIGLVFPMVTVLFSGPTQSHEEVEALRKGFMVKQGPQRLVAAVQQVQQQAEHERTGLEGVERGYCALLSVARFCGPLRAGLIAAGCLDMVLRMIRQLVGRWGGDDMGVLERLGAVLCEVVREMSFEQKAAVYLRENNVGAELEKVLKVSGAGGMGIACRSALAALGY